MPIELHVVVDAVGRQHRVVVVAQRNPCAWRCSGHLFVVAELAFLFLLGLVAEQCVVRAFVRNVGLHGDDGVEENHKVGLCLSFGVRSDG